jgi:hypothetical protein
MTQTFKINFLGWGLLSTGTNIQSFKKGFKSKVKNYRPISDLCSTTKIFEKLILNQIAYLEKTNKLDFNSKQKHGFKKNKSTSIKKYFIANRIKLLLTTYFYSILFIIMKFGYQQISVLNLKVNYSLHLEKHCKPVLTCTTPSSHLQIFIYNSNKQTLVKLEITGYCFNCIKFINVPDHIELVQLANQIISTSRQTHFEIQKTNKFKIGLNILSNKLYCLNNQIELNNLNLPIYAFKKSMKIKYLILNNLLNIIIKCTINLVCMV